MSVKYMLMQFNNKKEEMDQGQCTLDKEIEGIDTFIKNPKTIPKRNTSKTKIQFFCLLYIRNPSSRSYPRCMVHPLCFAIKKSIFFFLAKTELSNIRDEEIVNC